MKIGELAHRSGVSTRALRYYEEQGLLAPNRTSGGQRTYDDIALDRVLLIQRLYAAGLSSTTILELMPCVYAGLSTPDSLRRLAQEREKIDQQITELVATRDRLDSVIGSAAKHPADPDRQWVVSGAVEASGPLTAA